MITWIFVGDASYARVFKTTGSVQKMQLVEEFDHPESRQRGSDLISDRPGSASVSAGIHGGTPSKTPPKEVEARHFAEQMARFLNKGQAERAYDRLILVAPPHFLGLIKGHLTDPARKLVAEALHKDFAHQKQHELVKSLERYLK